MKELMVEVILMAFQDYQAFQEHGLIVRGRVQTGRRVRVKYARIGDVYSVVWFFWCGGAETVAELGGIRVDLARLRRTLEPEACRELQAEGKAGGIGGSGRLEDSGLRGSQGAAV